MGTYYAGIVNSGYSDELYHHGIAGQKWGVRRFQNSDGSLTEAGRKRYGSSLGSTNKSNDFTKDSKGFEKKFERYNRLQGTKSLLGGDHTKDEGAKVLKEYHDVINKNRSKLKNIAATKGKDAYKNSVSEISSKFIDKYAKAVLKDMGYEVNDKTVGWLVKQPWFGMRGANNIVF